MLKWGWEDDRSLLRRNLRSPINRRAYRTCDRRQETRHARAHDKVVLGQIGISK